ncbi:MAG: heavy-metal-associated domain-containing protein [Clostridia bacterium]|nr:heavy-metal-associated domain-containing protein [Clostridia bacterium]MBQ4610809.1 heavy-metal-associated domain-containing protein [Clostridia bacterium]
MRRHYKIRNIDCANCAMKMEEAISRIPGVNSARVSFITGRLTIDSDAEDMTCILEQAGEACRKIDRASSIVL